MDNGDNFGDLRERTGLELKADFLLDVREQLFITKFSKDIDLSQGNGHVVDITRLLNAPIVTSPQDGATTGVGYQMSLETLRMPFARYTAWTPTNDHVIKTAEDPTLMMATSHAKRQLAETVERLAATVILGGTNIIYANGTTRAGVNSLLKEGHIDAALRILEVNEASPVTEMQKSTADYETRSIDAAYIAIIPHELSDQYRGFSKFVRVEHYSSRVVPFENEIGSIGRVRVIASHSMFALLGAGAAVGGDTVIKTGGNANVYQSVIFGDDSFAFGGLMGEDSTRLIIHKPSVDSVDKTGDRGHVAWKTWFGGLIKQNRHIVRIECVARSSSSLLA